MVSLGLKKKRGYQVDLKALQAQSAANYARIMRLYPHMLSEDCCQFDLARDERVIFDVLERGPYTSLLKVRHTRPGDTWLGSTSGQLRVYHDVGMVDVVDWSGKRRVQPRYPYPNPDMMQEDEKWQLSRFLGDWLDFCLANGQAELATLVYE